MTLKQMAYRIMNQIEGGNSQNQDNYNLPQIYFDIHQLRSLMLRREAANIELSPYSQRISAITMQSIQETVDVPSAFIGMLEDSRVASIYKSQTTIPEPVAFVEYLPITFVGNNQFGNIKLVEPRAFKYQGYNKYSGHLLVASFHNNNIYILHTGNEQAYNQDKILNTSADMGDLIDSVNIPSTVDVEGVFDNPADVPNFDEDQSEYPISNQMAYRIIEHLIRVYRNLDMAEQRNEMPSMEQQQKEQANE